MPTRAASTRGVSSVRWRPGPATTGSWGFSLAPRPAFVGVGRWVGGTAEGIEAALAALTARERNDEAAIRLAQSALAEARYQADRVEAQFNAVEPANQNVFHNLARKWEACLSRVRDCEARLQAL